MRFYPTCPKIKIYTFRARTIPKILKLLRYLRKTKKKHRKSLEINYKDVELFQNPESSSFALCEVRGIGGQLAL